MIKVAHVITTYRGVVTILAPKLAALDAFNDLEIVAISPPSLKDLALPPPAVRHETVPIARTIKPLSDARSLWLLYQHFRRERYDIVHSHTSKAGFISALAARLAGVPLILHTYHGLPMYEGQNHLKNALYLTLERIACRCRHHVFSQNWRDLSTCQNLMGSAEKASYEGNGVSVSQVCEAASLHIDSAKREYPTGGLRIALISRLEPVKRVGDFIDACALLVSRGVEVSAVVAGFGPEEPRLRQLLQKHGLAEHVRLLGWVQHVPSLLAASDVVALTSEKEGIPRALMEAMALGKPVVATDVLGTQELVVDGQTGFLTPMGDSRSFADALERLGGDPKLCHRLGSAGKARIEEQFNDLKIAENLRGFYLEYDARCKAKR